MLTIFLNQLLFPTVSYALTGGPTQPEVHGFEPVNSNQMVDLFTGDFTYSVPLMDVGGYPINLAYHAGAKMDQEASMVGLGWSLTPGAINRTIRGIPDDFKGDEVVTQQNIRANQTWGIGVSFPLETIGKEWPLSLGTEMYYNNYKGFGTKFKAGVDFDFGIFNRVLDGSSVGTTSLGGSLSLNITSDSKEGVSLQPNFGLNYSREKETASGGRDVDDGSRYTEYLVRRASGTGSIGMTFSSGRGLTSLSLGRGFSSTNSTDRYTNYDDYGEKTSSVSRLGGSATLSTSIGYTAYLPSQPQNMLNYNVSFDYSTDVDVLFFDGQMEFNGYYSTQWMRKKDQNAKAAAYGALYNSRVASKVEREDKTLDKLLDFNRTTDYAYQHGSTNLQLSQTTHDIYSIAGQGTGGSFRLHTNDIPIYGDPISYNRSTAYPNTSIGIEAGPSTKFGANVGLSSHYSHSGSWLESWGNELAANNPEQIEGQNAFFEQRYFMKSGEMTPIDTAITKHDLELAPAQPQIDFTNSLKEYKLRSRLKTVDGTEKTINTASRASKRLYERRDRNSAIDYLTNAEAKTYGLNRSVFSYGDLLSNEQYQTDEAQVYSRAELTEVTETSVRKDHHIGAFKVTEPNGTKYVYDLPAYNFTAYDVGFNVDAIGENNNHFYYQQYQTDGLISYDAQDASIKNENGQSHFFNRRSVPAHAHAYLLTGILSPDYVDVLNDGITEDDLGTAVKFNYSLHTDQYGWRSPYEEGKARFNEGLRSRQEDDKASYSYGTKELWYVHSIESKTHIAEFYYSDREDALGVSDERGTKGTSSEQKMRKLDRIELYNKVDRFTNKEDAVPIKVVHFSYTYELCKGVPNHVNSAVYQGKLTLKKLSFSYGTSKKAMMSPYVFHYDGLNPTYNPLAYDSWSGYKPNDPDFPNQYFPYTEQDKSLADNYASAWNLTQVDLPSGGQMNIEYESDDYAYVMEHDAHRMFRLKGISDQEDYKFLTDLGKDKDVLFDENGKHLYLYLFFDLESSGGTDESIKERYMPRNNMLHYRFSTYIKDRNEPEFISGFAEIEDMGIDDDNSTIGWMKIKPHELDGGDEVHPISFDAWNFILQNLNEKVFEASEVPNDNSEDKTGINTVFNQWSNLWGFITGKYQQMQRRDFASHVDLAHCVMRLKDPDGRKLGGGHRVKQLSMTDNWSDVTDANYQDGVYGTVYAYTEDGDADTYSASTGVASNETAFAIEESPYRIPITFNVYKFPKQQKKKLKERWLKRYTNEAEIMGPIGEAFFPNPSVGYSKVTVRSLATAQQKGSPTGKSVHQFYTTRSHPIRIEQTPIDHHYRNTNPLLALATGTSWTRTAASQGYTVITNDMNGRPFSTESFDHKGDLISGSKYVYQTSGNKKEIKSLGSNKRTLDEDLSLASKKAYDDLQLDYSSSENNWLDNEVRVLDRYGNLKNRTLGMEYDISVDTRASRSISWSGSFQSNLDISLITGLPIVIPMLLFGSKYQKSKFNSATATKIVQQHAILKSVVAFDEQSVVRTENVLWDEKTGQVLLTKTYNEYNDGISNFSYPAHYAYKNLGSPVKNQGLEIKKANNEAIQFKDGIGTVASAEEYFTEGDVLATEWRDYEIQNKTFHHPVLGTITNEDTIWETYSLQAWVKEVKGNQLFLIDREGSPLSGHATQLKVIESGYKNILGGSVAAFTTMEEVDVNQSSFQIPGQVTQTSAATFSDHWQTYDDEVLVEKCDLDTSIAYVLRDVLDDAASGTYFDTLGANSDAKYHLSRTTSFAGSPIADLLHDHTGYPTAVSGSCTDSSYNDTFYVYNVVLKNGQTIELRFSGSEPPADAFDQYESWSINRTLSVQRVLKSNCLFDTTYADYLRYSAANTVPGSFHFTLGDLGENPDINYCELVLHDSSSSPILSLGDINGFSNIRLDESKKDGRHFLIDAHTASGTVVLQGSTTCFSLANCWKECQRTEGDIVNPYVIGIRGIWRGKDNYAYHADRTVTVASNEYTDKTMIRHDGAFGYQPMWTFDTQNGGLEFNNSSSNWISPATLTKVSPAGNHIESVDALGRPSAEIYGYQRKLVSGVAQNAGHHEIGFDGFEDYDYPYYIGCRKEAHWSMQENNIDFAAKAIQLSESPDVQVVILDSMTIYLTQDEVHTGRASLRVPKNNFVSATNIFFDSDTSTHDRGKLEAYQLGKGEIIQNFAPEKGKKYVISAWVKEGGSSARALSTYSNAYMRVKINGVAQSQDFYPEGPIIEGWQRVFAEFTIPDDALASSISIEAVVGNVQGNEAYFDDIRIQPYNSAMVSYVYDPMTLRLSAELDENNFATFYEYDQEGRLLRIKKETERGIVTLQESRYGIPKQ